jgi:uncharacterized protein (DUF488 family)
VWTVGHSTRSTADFLEVLRGHGISMVADVRRFPRSRRHPHFDADMLARSLQEAGMRYVAAPGLGGRRRPEPASINGALSDPGFRGYADYMQTAAFAAELEALVSRAAEERPAVMCAEAMPWRCHRWLLADALVARGIAVTHILDARRAAPHRLSAWARVVHRRVMYPSLADPGPGAAAAVEP